MSSKPKYEEWTRSYEDACKDDEKLQSLDTRTEEVINSLCAGGRGLSIDCLKAITQCLRDWNYMAVDAIFKYKEFVCEGLIPNSEFSKLIQDYLENSSQNLSFLSELDNFVMAAADSHLLITRVVGQYYENHGLVGVEKMKGISENLKNLKAYVVGGDDNSALGFLKKVSLLQDRQNQLLNNLAKEMEEVDKLKSENKELKQKKARAKTKTIMFVCIGLTLFILGAVAAAFFLPAVLPGVAAAPHAHGAVAVAAAPHVPGAVTGLAASQVHGGVTGLAALHTVVGGFAATAHSLHWILPPLTEYTALQAKRDVINSMQIGAMAVIKEWGEIESHLRKVEGSIGSLLRNANQASYTGVDNAVNDMKNHLEKFKDNITDLQTKSSTCAAEIKRTRDEVLMVMKSRPTKNN